MAVLTLLIIALLFTAPKEEKKNEEADLLGEPMDFHINLTEEEKNEIRRAYSLLPQPIQEHIPEEALYSSIEYSEDILDYPVFSVTLKATNWEEFGIAQSEAIKFFKKFGVDCCKYPLREAFGWNAEDWTKFDFDSPDPKIPLCP